MLQPQTESLNAVGSKTTDPLAKSVVRVDGGSMASGLQGFDLVDVVHEFEVNAMVMRTNSQVHKRSVPRCNESQPPRDHERRGNCFSPICREG